MSKKLLARLLALTMCAGLVLQPMTAYAEEPLADAVIDEAIEEVQELEEIPELEEAPELEMLPEAELLDDGEEPPIAKVRWIREDSISIRMADYYKVGDICPNLSIETSSPILDYYFAGWQEDGKAGWADYPDEHFFSGRYRAIVAVSVKEECKSLWKLDNDFQLTVNDEQWIVCTAQYDGNFELKALEFASPAVTVLETPTPGKQINIEKVVATSNIEELTIEKAPIGEPTFNITEGDVVVFSGTWMHKVDEGEWEVAQGRFTPGIYQYDVEVDVADEYKVTHVLDNNLKLEVNGIQWKRIFSIGGSSGYEFVSPEYMVEGTLIEELPEITGVYISDNQLYWDKLGDWGFYRIEIGDTREVVKYLMPCDLVQFCEFYDVPYGSYTVKITAVDFMDIGGFEHSKTAEVPWVYGKPAPVQKTKITSITATSNMADIIKFGAPLTTPTFTIEGDQGVVVTGGRWLKYANGGQKVEATEDTFSNGGWYYEVTLDIDDEHKDLYEFDQYMKLIVDGLRWNATDDGVFVSRGDTVIDEENRVVIEKINATGNISEIFVKGATYRAPTITDNDGLVYFSTMDALKKDGDTWTNLYAFGDTLGEGEYYFRFVVSLQDDYVYSHRITEETKVIIDGLECTMVSPGTTVGEGVIQAIYKTGVKEIKADEPEDPEEIQGTWTTKWGATYFVKENGEKATGVQKINGGYYLFSKRGTLQKNTFYEEDGKKYYFGADGIRVTGWRTKWTCTYYFDENGVMQTGFVDIDGGTYYFNAKGHQVKNDWVTVDSKKYYVKGDGTLARSQTITKWGKKYSFDADGVLIP